MGRKKRLRKGIASLEKQIVKHGEKIAEYEGPKDTLVEYWEGEIERLEMAKREKLRKLRKR
jgi:hypothetical protein